MAELRFGVVSEIRALLSGTEVHHCGAWYRVDGLDLDVLPAPRSSPRLLVGAGGPRMLRMAARHADIVGVLPAPIRNSQDDDELEISAFGTSSSRTPGGPAPRS